MRSVSASPCVVPGPAERSLVVRLVIGVPSRRVCGVDGKDASGGRRRLRRRRGRSQRGRWPA